ncbi:Peroxiredoxin [Tranquillimonas rosea]|uniref:Peroxiredoxin n=1 Tax=Tranquillimonas rosea TaxID=641238 RepID=A0A1H9UAI2_9RHOB|nr:peroxiredoxin-like family protein [Tranquillimonas rosea]SES06103.1 Peroxiredoxin [Tranquillimonas rosea]
MLTPAQKTPALSLPTIGGGTFDLDNHHGKNGTLLVFYRGLHCPICIGQLSELSRMQSRFDDLGIATAAVSTDPEDRAAQTREKAEAEKVTFLHSLSQSAARFDWGLWMSSARPDSDEPEVFSEPGMFFVSPDRTLVFGWVQTSPFARPQLEDVAGAIAFHLEKGYPARGQYDGPLDQDAA